MLLLTPMQSYSKGARGLSVLPRVPGIFTEIAVSLSPWPRQWGNRYAIRAGRNLPDKEFRYPFTSDGTPSPEVTVLICRVP